MEVGEESKELADAMRKLASCQKRVQAQRETILNFRDDGGENKLNQSSVEAYCGMLLGLLLALLPMTWYLRAILFVFLAVLCIDFVRRSPFTYRWIGWIKACTCIAVFVAISYVGFGNVTKQYREDSSPPKAEYITGYGAMNAAATTINYPVGRPDLPPIINGPKKSHLTVDGRLLKKFADKYQIVGQTFFYDNMADTIDAQNPSRSAAYDIYPEEISLVIPWNQTYIDGFRDRPTRSVFQLLLVPRGISMSGFKSTRDSMNSGVILLQEKALDVPLAP